MRTRISLDGPWSFQYDEDASLTPLNLAAQRVVSVPMPWQAQFPDLRYKSGVAWYVRRFSAPSAEESAAILHFGAVDYHATVWLNGDCAGAHEGGYLPFEFDVSHLLRSGENELIVRVADGGDEFHFSEIPYGKQNWYGPISGIWQPVWLELRADSHVRSLRLTPDCHSGKIAVDLQLSRPAAGARLQLQALDPDGAPVAAQTVELAARDTRIESCLQLEAPVQRWHIGRPALYTVHAELWCAERLVDSFEDHCGFRTVEARDGRIYLNDEPIYLRGALDQGYYPETIYTAPDLHFLEDQARKAQSLGLNCLRMHIKIEDPRYFDVADRLGLLVWAELPSWGRLTPASEKRVEQTLRQMVARDWNHPSIIAWTLVNEDWGADLCYEPAHRQWLADFYKHAKELDPTRLVIDNSPCEPSFHVASDLEDYHYYRLNPDHTPQWEAWLDDFSTGAPWAWAADHAAGRRLDLPRIVSEFGQWGLPHPDCIQEQGAEPWWFENGMEWDDGTVYPHGLRQRFDAWNLDRVFGSFDAFIFAHQQHMAQGLKTAIAAIRARPALGGYVITEFTDVHWEANGLLDMQRHVKADLQTVLAPMNQDRVVIARPQAYSGAPGAEIEVEVRCFDVDGPGQGGVLRWSCAGQHGQLAAPGGAIRVTLPPTAGGTQQRLTVAWCGAGGETLACDEALLACPRPPAWRPALHIAGDDAQAQQTRAALQSAGYPLHDVCPDVLWVTRRLTPNCREHVAGGGRLLLLASSAEEQALPYGRIRARSGSSWQGDWASSFSWLRRDEPFAGLPGGPLLDMSFLPVTPTAVIAGLPAWLARDYSRAGLAVGWLHKHVSLLATMPYGQGSMTVTTFDFPPAVLASDALAQTLFNAIVSL